MNLWLRVLKVLVISFFRPRLGFRDESLLHFRVAPSDLDINVHMNNARYLAIMDLGRWDLIIRSGMWRLVLKTKMQPVLGGSVVRFRRSLRPFQPFSLRTRLIAWDERWVYIEHRIESGGALYCWGLMRAGFVRGGQLMPPPDVAEAVGYAGEMIAPPGWVQGWRDCELGFEQYSPPLAAGEEKTCVR